MNASPTDNSQYDYVIVGGGTAGCVVASRLTEDPNTSVLLIEAGGDPPFESVLPGIFTLEPQMDYDYNLPAINDNYTSQNLQGQAVQITAGKMLGGSSGLEHLLQVRGTPKDYDDWGRAAGTNDWGYDKLLPYFRKSENVKDIRILRSPTAKYHGTNGYIGITREPSTTNEFYFDAFGELGYEKKLDLNGRNLLGIAEPTYFIDNGVRQSGADYIAVAKNRPNLVLLKQATVTKILFNEDKNATGVIAVKSNDETVTIQANKEVILSAGAIKSPQLLKLSGVGPKDELEKWNIPVVVDSPYVGYNLQDHISAVVVFKTRESNGTAASNPHLFPVPTTLSYKTLNPDTTNPDYQSINLIFPHDSAGLLQLCANVFKYSESICNDMYAANNGREVIFGVVNKGRPVSTGNVKLNGTSIFDNPSVFLGHYSNKTDLEDMAKYLLDFAQLNKTETFKNVNSDLADINLPKCAGYDKDTIDYWTCYAIEMSSTIWHYSGTVALGKVLNSNLEVIGARNIRVVDASAMPNLVSGNIMSAVIALAEKAADLIKNKQQVNIQPIYPFPIILV